MRQIISALVDPAHLAILLPIVLITIVYEILDILGLAVPRYDYIAGVLSFGYIASVVISLVRGPRA
jgi:hypothetical protein